MGRAGVAAQPEFSPKRGFYAMIRNWGTDWFRARQHAVRLFRSQSQRGGFSGRGWRYPFFVAFAINVVALFARLRIVASSEFGAAMDAQELQPRPVFEMLSKHSIDVILGHLSRWRASPCFTSSPSFRSAG